MTKQKERARSIQSFVKIFSSGRYDEVLLMLNSGLVNKFVNGLLRFSETKPPRYEKMRDQLDDALSAGEKIQSTRPPRARLVWPEFQKTLGSFLKKAKVWRGDIIKEEKQYEKEGTDSGLVEVDIVFTFVNYNNEPPKSGKVEINLPASKVTLKSALSKGGCRFRGIMLEPKKSRANIDVSMPRKLHPKLHNHIVYNPLKKGDVLVITAKEDPVKATKKGFSAEGAIKKAGVKGHVGLDFTVVSGGGEITKEKELSKTHGKELSYTILWPKGSMSLSQQ